MFQLSALLNNCSLLTKCPECKSFLEIEASITAYNICNGKMNVTGLGGRINGV